MAIFDMTSKEAASPTVATMILLSVILTSFGVYDKLAQWAVQELRFRLLVLRTVCAQQLLNIVRKDLFSV